jgi:hypothetical protein
VFPGDAPKFPNVHLVSDNTAPFALSEEIIVACDSAEFLPFASDVLPNLAGKKGTANAESDQTNC